MIRLRVTYTKSGSLRYTSNLDLQKILERTFRRAELPLSYSQGFHPQPRINQASPLPLGFIGSAEMVEIWLDQDDVSETDILTAINNAAPSGLQVQGIEQVPLIGPTLPTRVLASEYHVTLPPALNFGDVENRIDHLLHAETLIRQRKERTYDLRPLIENLWQINDPVQSSQKIGMQLAAREGATGRPEEVLLAMDIDPFTTRIERTRLILKDPSST